MTVTGSAKSDTFVTQSRKHLTSSPDDQGTRMSEAGGVGGRLLIFALQGFIRARSCCSGPNTALLLTSSPNFQDEPAPRLLAPGSGCLLAAGLPRGYPIVTRQAPTRQSRRSGAQSRGDVSGLPTRRSGVRTISDPGELWSALAPLVVTPHTHFLHSGDLKAQVRGSFGSPQSIKFALGLPIMESSTKDIQERGGVHSA